MTQQQRHLALTAVWLLCALVSFTIATLLTKQHTYRTRGIPPLTAAPIPQHDGPTLGLNVDLHQYNDTELDQQLKQISALNISYLKQPFYLTPDFDWAEAERIITAVSQHNLKLTALLDGDPSTQFTPPNIADYAQFSSEFATRFGNTIDHYIIWDEPNITTHWGNGEINPDQYGALLTAASQAIKTADPTAQIILAPLAPTLETNRINLADDLFLQALYDNGTAASFDIVSAKPYGFDTPPDNRDVGRDTFNLSRTILLREVMTRNGDETKPLWAGNWGWNREEGSPWGTVSTADQINFITSGFQRAQQEWPWLGHMYLQHWEPADPTRSGFTLKNHSGLNELPQLTADPAIAQAGFHFASPDDPAQQYTGDWEFSPEFGADVSEKLDNEPADTVTFTFYGTDVGLRVRRANYRARFYILIDGEPANALPPDETTNTANGRGTALVLNTNDPDLDTIETIPVATDLPLGVHTLTLTTSRGWDQFPLNGFAVSNQPSTNPVSNPTLIYTASFLFFLMAFWFGRQVVWHQIPIFTRFSGWYSQASIKAQLTLTAVAGLLVALSGWLTWGQQAAGIFRRWGETTQLALVFGTALTFYITPWLPIYLLALVALYLLLVQKPAWGVAITILSFPFYVTDTLKPIYTYRFSAVEIFTLVTFAATLTHLIFKWSHNRHISLPKWHKADTAALAFTAVATLSLFFTDQLGVATNEWRVIIIGPVLFYTTIRLLQPSKTELNIWIGTFVASGVLVAIIGLVNYTLGTNLITAEGGLMRLRAHYGSPNNVALYLGRVLPITLALLLFTPPAKPVRFWLFQASTTANPNLTGSQTRAANATDRGAIPSLLSTLYSLLLADWPRRILTTISTLMLLTILLTFSKGGLFVGLPITTIFLFIVWQQANGRISWPWLLGGAICAIIGYTVLLQIPIIAPRLDLTGATSDFRVNLWRSSINMWRDHPLIGVGLDNFLYEYRGRYILSTAWQEPNLNHPHQIILDFATRLGLLGLLAGTALFNTLISILSPLRTTHHPLAIGLLGTAVYMIAHGLVDHSFFLIDLAYVFYFTLGTAVWLAHQQQNE